MIGLEGQKLLIVKYLGTHMNQMWLEGGVIYCQLDLENLLIKLKSC